MEKRPCSMAIGKPKSVAVGSAHSDKPGNDPCCSTGFRLVTRENSLSTPTGFPARYAGNTPPTSTRSGVQIALDT